METTNRQTTAATSHQGGCHCGLVRFRVQLVGDEGATRCNCSVSTKIAPTAGMVKPDAFTLLAGQEHLGAYQWGAKISTRFFCRACGVHCFGRGFLEEVGGDFVSVNLNCMDDIDPQQLPVVYWDGRHNHWEA